jgi:hypothetical protein
MAISVGAVEEGGAARKFAVRSSSKLIFESTLLVKMKLILGLSLVNIVRGI